MQYEQILRELEFDDLPAQYKQLAAKIGIEALVMLSGEIGGTQQYIPMLFELTKELVYRKIREEYDGDNIQALALKYHISESTVRRVLQEQIAKKKHEPFEGQVTLII